MLDTRVTIGQQKLAQAFLRILYIFASFQIGSWRESMKTEKSNIQRDLDLAMAGSDSDSEEVTVCVLLLVCAVLMRRCLCMWL